MKARLIRAAPQWLTSDAAGRTAKEPPSIQLPLGGGGLPTTRKEQRVEGADIPASRIYRIALSILACFQNSLVGGLVYGWASINPMLTEPILPKGGCGMTLADSTLIFSMASCTGMASTLLLGFVLDRFGPRVCSVTSHVAIAAGCQLFAVSTEFQGFAVSTSLIAFGGPGIGVSIVHLANLFPRNQFTALAMLNGTISVSMSVFAVFSWLWERYDWICYRALFGYFSFLVILSLLGSLLVWPDYSFKAPKPAEAARHDDAKHTVEDDYIEAATVHQRWMTEQPLNSYLRKEQRGMERHSSFILSKKAIESGVWNMVSLKDAPFGRQFQSGYYLRGNLFFGVVCLLANFYVASITTELADANEYTVPEQNQLTRIFGFVMAGGFLASFVIGLIMDHAGVEAATTWTIGLAMCHELILIFLSTSRLWMTVGFVLYVFYRQFLFPVSIALITARLGFKYFGLLNGIAFLLSGVVQLFMVPVVNGVKGTCHDFNSTEEPIILDECDHGKWLELHVAEFVVLALLLLVPFYDQRAKVAEKKRHKEMAQMRASWRILYVGSSSTASMSPLLGRSGSSNGSYGSAAATSPSFGGSASILEGRDVDVLDEIDDEGLQF